jgi:O-acetylserine/cysteine efflux transporter
VSPGPSPRLSPRLQSRELAAIAAVILIWGLNNAFTKHVVEHLPPLTAAATRFAMTLVVLIPFLRLPTDKWRALLLVALISGPLHFGLIFIGYALAGDLAPIAIMLQLWIPFTALLSVLMLGERLGALRIVGLCTAFGGVVVMGFDPRVLAHAKAIPFLVGGSFLWALAAVVSRKVGGLPPLRLQAWIALLTACVLGGATAVADGPRAAAALAGAPADVWALQLFAALASGVGANGLMHWLLGRVEASRTTPYMLLTPVVTIIAGVAIFGDRVSVLILAGGVVALGGVALVALAERRRANLADLT